MKRTAWVPIAAVACLILTRIFPTSSVETAVVPALLGRSLGLLAWCLTLAALGWITFPLVRGVLRRLPDEGWFLARWAGLFLVGWGAWLLSSLRLVAFWPWGVSLSAAILAGLAWLHSNRSSAERNSRAEGGEAAAARIWRLGGELLFWGVFAALVLVRYLNPDLLHPTTGGEKPMELAILNSLLRAPFFPPEDPWLAGHALNYYYFGFVPVALLVRLTGLPVSTGFNLAVPTVGALSAVGALLVVGFLVRPSTAREADRRQSSPFRKFRRALWGPLLLLGMGNLVEPKLLASGFRRLAAAGTGPLFSVLAPLEEAARGCFEWLVRGAAWPYATASLYWNATRSIPHPPAEAAPISEFPLFTLLFADLHPHLIALPAILFLVLVLLATARRESGQHPDRGGYVLTGLVAGTVVLINPWDLPLVALLMVVGPFAWSGWKRWRTDLLGIVATASVAAVVLLPFLATYAAPVGGVRLWRGGWTPLSAFLWIHGLFVLVIIWWLSDRLPRVWRRSRAASWEARAWPWAWLAASVSLALFSRWGWIPGTTVVLLPLAAALLLLIFRTPSARDRTISGLLLVGCILALVPEALALQGDVGRMNLLFKLYFEIWWLWSLGAAACVSLLLRRVSEPAAQGSGAGRGWRVALYCLLAASLVYPPLAARARVLDRIDGAAGWGLDGYATLSRARYPLDGDEVSLGADFQAVGWLQKEVAGRPVVAEAVTDDYGLGGRISSATGLPTVLGWPGHELQQRQSQNVRDELNQRRQDVRRIYSETSSKEILPLLRRYGVSYVVVGALERTVYGEAGLEKFRSDSGIYWDPVFEVGGFVLYRVREAEGPVRGDILP